MNAFIYKGKYSGNERDLPHREHPEGTVPFKEPEDMKKLTIVANIISAFILIGTISLLFIRGGLDAYNIWGVLLAFVSMVPHEYLHGICMPGTVYMYQNLRQGMLFVINTEDMTKAQFILMSLMPNLVFGLLPFLLFLIEPQWTLLGSLGAFSLGMGAGDYINVYNAATQMPKGALTFLDGMHSFWYIPKER